VFSAWGWDKRNYLLLHNKGKKGRKNDSERTTNQAEKRIMEQAMEQPDRANKRKKMM